MPPIFEYDCLDCGHKLEVIYRTPEDEPVGCPNCGHDQLQRAMSMIGAYYGDLGGSSTRPKNAGSFKVK